LQRTKIAVRSPTNAAIPEKDVQPLAVDDPKEGDWRLAIRTVNVSTARFRIRVLRMR